MEPRFDARDATVASRRSCICEWRQSDARERMMTSLGMGMQAD